MRCPYCGNDDTQVKDSRPSEDNTTIRRRRSCLACGGRFTTFERIQLRELMVLKRSGRRLPFDRDKLMRSVQVALRKRPVEPERVERMVSGIVRQLENMGESDVKSEIIGRLVMEGLRQLDDVAYVRFASVYRNFREAKDFEDFLGESTGECAVGGCTSSGGLEHGCQSRRSAGAHLHFRSRAVPDGMRQGSRTLDLPPVLYEQKEFLHVHRTVDWTAWRRILNPRRGIAVWGLTISRPVRWQGPLSLL